MDLSGIIEGNSKVILIIMLVVLFLIIMAVGGLKLLSGFHLGEVFAHG